jgi:hypothetical protein
VRSSVADELGGDGVITVSNSMIYEQGDASRLVFDDGGNNRNGVDPLLSPDLDLYGGKYNIPIAAAFADSPAVDYLSSLNLTTDGRNFLRGISRDGAAHAKLFDIGAFEFDPNTQAETLGLISSSAPVSVLKASGYSNGAGARFAATKIGDTAVYYNPIQTDGNYDVVVRFAKGPDEGIVQLEWSSTRNFSSDVHAIGTPQDLYASSSAFFSRDYNVVLPFDPDDSQFFRFRVTGKNKSSTGFAVLLDYMNLVYKG